MNIFVNMISVVVIGYGNVAFHLINAFIKAQSVKLVEVYARDLNKIEHLTPNTSITNNLNTLQNADVYIIAVSDDAIPLVSAKIKNTSGIIVHTSGAASIKVLNTKNNKGVFYPLQSFSREKEVDFNIIPFCLETENNIDLTTLENLAKAIGKKTYTINSKQRQYMHAAAVFVNNFTNHLFKIGYDVCNEHNIPFEVMLPLIQETVLKIEKLSPKDAQTGPAIRNDKKTIAKHMSLLNKEQQTIYKLLTKSIQNG